MSEEFMRRFAPLVQTVFPVLPGERKSQYVERICTDWGRSPARDAFVAQCAKRVERELARERQARKDAWIAAARRSFRPSRPAPCQVCGKYRDLAHAHHVVPLGHQFERGFDRPDHDHVWLCPTHHAAIHALIGGHDDGEQSDERLRARGRRGLDGLVDMELAELDVLLDLLSMSGWGK